MGVCPRFVALASSVVIAFAALACAAACSSFAAAGTPGDLVAESGTDALAVDGTASEASPDTDAASGEAAFVLARDYPDLGAVTATDTTVYFTQPTPGAVRSVDLETGGAVSDMQLNEGTPASIVVLGSKVVWGDRSKSTLRSRSLDGGDITTQTLAGGLRPVAIAVAADKLVVVATGAGDSGKLQVYDSALTLETSTAAAYQNPWDVAVLGSSVWWTESGGNAIWRATLPGFTVPTTIATVESDCRAIAVDPQGKLFWARYDDNLVRGFGMSGAFTLSPGEVNPLCRCEPDARVLAHPRREAPPARQRVQGTARHPRAGLHRRRRRALASDRAHVEVRRLGDGRQQGPAPRFVTCAKREWRARRAR